MKKFCFVWIIIMTGIFTESLGQTKNPYAMKRLPTFILLLAFLSGCIHQAEKDTDFQLSKEEFLMPPTDAKLHTWWHWMEGHITKEGITKDLEAMHQNGIVQATILNIGRIMYNSSESGFNFAAMKITDGEQAEVKFNSPEWYEMFGWALKEADRLGMKIGVQNCDGWSTSGGPWITPEYSMKQVVWTKSVVQGGNSLSIPLAKPYHLMDYYEEIGIFAIPVSDSPNSTQTARPKVSVYNEEPTEWLTDGCPLSGHAIEKNIFFQFSFSEPFRVEKVVIHPEKSTYLMDTDAFRSQFRLHSSDDGINYRELATFETNGLNISFEIDVKPTSASFFRLEVTGYDEVPGYVQYKIAEIELLKKDEAPLYHSALSDHLYGTAIAGSRVDKIYKNQNLVFPDTLAYASTENMIDLTGHMTEDGILEWDAPEGNWALLRIGYTSTGMMIRPPTPEGRGLECDKFSKEALRIHFDNFPAKLIEHAGAYTGNTFKFLLIDSWECKQQNWSKDFADEFAKRRGYEITKWLPVICGEVINSPEESDAFLYDFRHTLADLTEENYYREFSTLCHQNDLEMHAEVIYGGAFSPPLDVLKANSYTDLHMQEFWTTANPDTRILEYTPDNRHTQMFPHFTGAGYDRPVTGAEAYTGHAHYSEAPWELKPFGDRAYCSGVNQFILHSYVHQAYEKKPGLTLAPFGSHFNRHNTNWRNLKSWSDYHARVQYVLQQGYETSQILYFLGDGLPQVLPPWGNDLLPGYSYTLCNKDVLENKVTVNKGKILFDNGLSFDVLCLPESKKMSLETLKLIEHLVEKGAVVIGPKPEIPIDLKGVQNEKEDLERIADMLWGEGKVRWGRPVNEFLKELEIPLSFETTTPDANDFLYIKKRVDLSDVFYVANQHNREISTECLFSTDNNKLEIWNPETGLVSKPAIYVRDGARIELPVTFEPYQSLFFVFSEGETEKNIVDDRLSHPDTLELSEFSADITFHPAYTAPFTEENIKTFQSWTESQTPSVKYFSGYAVYTIQFKLDAADLSKQDSVLLLFDKIYSTAHITLNGHDLGYFWNPDVKVNVSGLLKQENSLVVEVTNEYRNRIIGDYIEFGDLKNIWTTSPVHHFFDKESPLKESGIVGDIKLMMIP